jgi:hypothetical protein
MALWRRQANASSSGVSLKAALDYLRLGWSVIPVEPRGKRPLVRWEVYQHRRPEAPELADWFRRWPDANLAIVTGIVSGLVALDLDPRRGADASLERLRLLHGAVPETVEARTGGGGRHLYFRHPGDILPNQVGIEPGIDLCGDGGYLVAPPSTHADGAPYRWIRSPEVLPASRLPDWLLRILRADTPRQGNPLDGWRHLLREGAPEGERNESIASLAGHLLHSGVDPAVTAELLLAWNAVRCRPPLDEAEVVRAVEALTRIHRRDAGGDG